MPDKQKSINSITQGSGHGKLVQIYCIDSFVRQFSTVGGG